MDRGLPGQEVTFVTWGHCVRMDGVTWQRPGVRGHGSLRTKKTFRVW